MENDYFADDAVEDAEKIDTPVSIGRQPLCNLRFTDAIDLLRGSEEKLQQLTERLEKRVLDTV